MSKVTGQPKPQSPKKKGIPPLSLEGHTDPLQLIIGERVVWLSQNGPEFGFVRWIGKLLNVSYKGWTIGVDFENAVGTGTGLYHDHQLF